MKQLLGGVLIAAGILIAGASGLCSLYMLISGDTWSSYSIGEISGMVMLVLLFGGPPIALGVGLAFYGRALIRRTRGGREKS